jgi:hypothetical protein
MKKRTRFPSYWLIVCAVGIVLVIIGILQGDPIDTFRKASLICYECIGIG